MRLSIVILDRETLGDDLDISALREIGDITEYANTTKDETATRIKDAHIVISNKVILTKEMMHQASKLQLICIAATGMNNIELDAAKELGIEVKNVTAYSTPSVVQHTFAMLFYLLEHMKYYDNIVQSGLWSLSGVFTDLHHPFFELSDKRWGIIGLGTIGLEVAKVASSFGAEVSYYSTSGLNHNSSFAQKELDSLLKESDIISIHAPLNEHTLNLINDTNLPLLKEKAIILNLGRGGIINETDLAYELDRREIYAGLDVVQKEPINMDNPLMKIEHKDRLLITPHIAWTSIEARERLLKGIVDNIQDFQKTKGFYV
jgi:glycerate dehydrogenase